jgi:hypothetical protein
MSEKTVIALFDTFDSAQAAVLDAVAAGAARDRIGMLANRSEGNQPGLLSNPAYAREQLEADSDTQSMIVTGAEVGIGLGCILGFLASSVAVPGIGLLLAGGTLISVAGGAAVFGCIGAAIGKMADHSVSDRDAKLYEEGLKRGGTLVTVQVDARESGRMEAIFKRHGAVDIEDRAPDWMAAGWVTFDPGNNAFAHI